MARKDPELRLRLPDELKEWLCRQAARNVRSMNGELVALLQAARQITEGPAARNTLQG